MHKMLIIYITTFEFTSWALGRMMLEVEYHESHNVGRHARGGGEGIPHPTVWSEWCEKQFFLWPSEPNNRESNMFRWRINTNQSWINDKENIVFINDRQDWKILETIHFGKKSLEPMMHWRKFCDHRRYSLIFTENVRWTRLLCCFNNAG